MKIVHSGKRYSIILTLDKGNYILLVLLHGFLPVQLIESHYPSKNVQLLDEVLGMAICTPNSILYLHCNLFS